MKQDTKETIGSRGTVAGFRPLIGEERWHKDSFTDEALEGGYRPLLLGELWIEGDEIDRMYRHIWEVGADNGRDILGTKTGKSTAKCRTKRPLPPPQVETFEAHGHVWYRHAPGDARPVEPDVAIEALCDYELNGGKFTNCIELAKKWGWDYDVVGYRFPDFPAVHTTLQQQQPSVDTQNTTKQRLATMYHGWCDVAPDSVAECIADVAKVLYPTDAERCEAEFQKWFESSDNFGAVKTTSRIAWKAAWSAAKQQNP